MFILHSSKTHGKGDKPQIIKISGQNLKSRPKSQRCFCPFQLLDQYSKARGMYAKENEEFFVFRDHTPMIPNHFRQVLRDTLIQSKLNPDFYCRRAFRSGCDGDLFDKGISVKTMRKIGRWKSSAVYTYLRS